MGHVPRGGTLNFSGHIGSVPASALYPKKHHEYVYASIYHVEHFRGYENIF